ncbi:trypsin-like cysteine/serine peptidase domain-containing protein [Gorgonomyces haynaldii]|nr:trypsin-like cysteine/serine peptidase domain-containing protein [Gorgonomyces haynaldii]
MAFAHLSRAWKPLSFFCAGYTLSSFISKPQASHVDKTFLADAAEKVLDSVVNISVETLSPGLFNQKMLVSSGSGFFIHSNGTILTNAHVVADMNKESKLIVTLSNGLKLSAHLHSMDTLADLAIVQLDERVPQLKPVVFGHGKPLRPGEFCLAIGSPFGLFNTVTQGIISSKRRKAGEIGGQDSRVEYIQTDCVVHSGSSGGPLIDLNGHVIGINTTRAESEGISFAIRVDDTMPMIKQLVKHGKIIRPYLGVKMVSLSPLLWQQVNQSGKHNEIPHLTNGILVTSVTPKSPAHEAGVCPQDVIVAVNNQPVTNTQEFLKQVGLELNMIQLDIRRNVPLEQDWDGSVKRYETIETKVNLQPRELDTFIRDET